MKNREKLKEILLNDSNILRQLVSDIYYYNGELEYLQYYDNGEDFFENYFDNKMEVARAICYGNYNYMDDYVRLNVYGNLESISKWELDNILKDNIEEILDVLEDNYDDYKDYIQEEIRKVID